MNRFWESPLMVPIVLFSVFIVVAAYLFHRPAVSAVPETQRMVQGPVAPLVISITGTGRDGSEKKHTVRKGDTLTRLTLRFCGNLGAMAGVIRDNGIKNPHRIFIDQSLTFKCEHAVSPEQVKKESASPGKFASSGGASQDKRISNSVLERKLRFRQELLARLDLADPDCLYAKHSGTWKVNTLARVVCIRKNYGETIERAAKEHKLPVNLLYAIVHQESKGQPDAVSPTGCKGIMQFESRTARGYGVTDVFDPFVSIPKGAHVLADYMRFWKNDLDRGIASYNVGPRMVGTRGFDAGRFPYTESVRRVWRLIDSMPG